MTTCWENSNLLNLKQIREISIGEYQHECLFIDKIIRYLTILEDPMQDKDTNLSIIHGHGEYQTLYLDMTMRVGTSATHGYGELQMIYNNSIRDDNPKVKHVHGELQTLFLNVIDISPFHTYYREINHLCKFRCSEQAFLHQNNSNLS